MTTKNTHCQRGHEFTPANTCYRSRGGSTRRVCRTCGVLRNARVKKFTDWPRLQQKMQTRR